MGLKDKFARSRSATHIELAAESTASFHTAVDYQDDHIGSQMIFPSYGDDLDDAFTIASPTGDRRSRLETRQRLRNELFGPDSCQGDPGRLYQVSSRETSNRPHTAHSTTDKKPALGGLDPRIQQAINAIQELSQTATPQELAEVQKALSKLGVGSSPGYAEVQDPANASVIRRRSLFTPGLATRDSPPTVLRKSQPKKAPKKSPAAENPSVADDQFWKPEMIVASPLATLARLKDGRQIPDTRPMTPSELDYSNLGAYKLGSLRIMNGAASPEPSVHSPPRVDRQQFELNMRGMEDYFTASEGTDGGSPGGSSSREPPSPPTPKGDQCNDWNMAPSEHMMLEILASPARRGVKSCASNRSLTRSPASPMGPREPPMLRLKRTRSWTSDNSQTPASPSPLQLYLHEASSNPFLLPSPNSPSEHSFSPHSDENRATNVSTSLQNLPRCLSVGNPESALQRLNGNSVARSDRSLPVSDTSSFYPDQITQQSSKAFRPTLADSAYGSESSLGWRARILEDQGEGKASEFLKPPILYGPPRIAAARGGLQHHPVGQVESTSHIGSYAQKGRVADLSSVGRRAHLTSYQHQRAHGSNDQWHREQLLQDNASTAGSLLSIKAMLNTTPPDLQAKSSTSSVLPKPVCDPPRPILSSRKTLDVGSLPSVASTSPNASPVKSPQDKDKRPKKLQKKRRNSSHVSSPSFFKPSPQTLENIPRIPSDVVANYLSRISRNPSMENLEHTFDSVSVCEKRVSPSTSPATGFDPNDIRFPSPVSSAHIADDDRGRKQKRRSVGCEGSSSCLWRSLSRKGRRKSGSVPRHEQETFVEVTDFGTVTESIGASPYDIAFNALKQRPICEDKNSAAPSQANAVLHSPQRPGPQSPHEISTQRSRRAVTGMSEQEASQFAMRRSRDRMLHQQGKEAAKRRPKSSAGEVPPVPSLPPAARIERPKSLGPPCEHREYDFGADTSTNGTIDKLQRPWQHPQATETYVNSNENEQDQGESDWAEHARHWRQRRDLGEEVLRSQNQKDASKWSAREQAQTLDGHSRHRKRAQSLGEGLKEKANDKGSCAQFVLASQANSQREHNLSDQTVKSGAGGQQMAQSAEASHHYASMQEQQPATGVALRQERSNPVAARAQQELASWTKLSPRAVTDTCSTATRALPTALIPRGGSACKLEPSQREPQRTSSPTPSVRDRAAMFERASMEASTARRSPSPGKRDTPQLHVTKPSKDAIESDELSKCPRRTLNMREVSAYLRGLG